jgi:hypothetical protein
VIIFIKIIQHLRQHICHKNNNVKKICSDDTGCEGYAMGIYGCYTTGNTQGYWGLGPGFKKIIEEY